MSIFVPGQLTRLAFLPMIVAIPVTAHAQLITLGDVIVKVGEVDTRVTALETQVPQLAVDLGALTLTTTGNQAQIASQGTVLTNISTQVAGNTSAIVNANAQLAVDASAIANLSGQLASNVTATVNANAQIGANTTAITNITNQVGGNTTDITSLNTQVTNNTATINALNTSVNSNTTAIATLDTRVTAHDARLATHDVQIAQAQSTADSALTQTVGLRAQIDAGTIGLVQQQGPSAPVNVASATGGTVVTFNGTGGDRRLSGVADGVAGNDASSLAQVRAGDASTLAAANTYTDQRVSVIENAIDSGVSRVLTANNAAIHRQINAAAASTAAISALPHSILPGEGMATMSIGGRGSDVAFAMGISKALKAPRTPLIRAGAALDARTGSLTYNAAIGFHF